MPRYSRKDYEKKDLYGLFIGSAVNSGCISDETLNWLYMNQALKEKPLEMPYLNQIGHPMYLLPLECVKVVKVMVGYKK